jgi:hypothetical protein
MAMQAQTDITTRPFILHSYPANRVKGTIKQDAQRATPLAPFTVLAKIAATGLYVPLTSVTATDGSAIPAGIYIGPAITAAALVAGNVTDCPILKSGARVDSGQLVLENSLTLATVVTVGALAYTAGVYVAATDDTFDAGTSDASFTQGTPASYTPGTATLTNVDVRTIGDHLESRMIIPVTTDAESEYEA